MKAQRDPKTGKWFIQYRYTDWTGERKHSIKRGFQTRREAEEWLRDFLLTQQSSLDMRFEDFVKIYYADAMHRIREHTMITKQYIIEGKILPYFGKLKMNAIKPADIRRWENTLIKQGYKPTYLKTIYNQLNAIFNYGVKFADLRANPCIKAGSMGKNKAEEMQIWTKEEFALFADAIIDKRESWMAFNVLFWTGMRSGELLALTLSDLDFAKKTIKIDASYQRLKRRDVITDPKTPKSFRIITMPYFLAADLQEYVNSLYGLRKSDRIFYFTKSYLNSEMKRGIKSSGVKKIRVHDLRHSHASFLLEELGVQPIEVAARLGDTIKTVLETYVHQYVGRQECNIYTNTATISKSFANIFTILFMISSAYACMFLMLLFWNGSLLD